MGKIGEIDWGGLWVRFALFGVMFLLLGVLLTLRYFDVVLGEVQLQQQIYRVKAQCVKSRAVCARGGKRPCRAGVAG
ncbi:hypothetical protein ACFPVS_10555 [Neisseria weixii]|uniref:Uncharacterized protein n=1 Tax=Neisseria weixii TaxID=1853276 RepID=A0A3N4MIF7_9NEIS|nr:hypothetical protein [Neisseria weixii]ATD65311.1 hypothetical protein CGZ65_08415 [Neisseria weixii]RPD83404.1 hypothetical protein EGK74_12555 [Neisseria weixii]